MKEWLQLVWHSTSKLSNQSRRVCRALTCRMILAGTSYTSLACLPTARLVAIDWRDNLSTQCPCYDGCRSNDYMALYGWRLVTDI